MTLFELITIGEKLHHDGVITQPPTMMRKARKRRLAPRASQNAPRQYVRIMVTASIMGSIERNEKQPRSRC